MIANRLAPGAGGYLHSCGGQTGCAGHSPYNPRSVHRRRCGGCELRPTSFLSLLWAARAAFTAANHLELAVISRYRRQDDRGQKRPMRTESEIVVTVLPARAVIITVMNHPG